MLYTVYNCEKLWILDKKELSEVQDGLLHLYYTSQSTKRVNLQRVLRDSKNYVELTNVSLQGIKFSKSHRKYFLVVWSTYWN